MSRRISNARHHTIRCLQRDKGKHAFAGSAFPQIRYAAALTARKKPGCNKPKIGYVHDMFDVILLMRPVGRCAVRCALSGWAEVDSGQTNLRAILAKRTSRQHGMVQPVGGAAARCVRVGWAEVHFGQTNFASARTLADRRLARSIASHVNASFGLAERHAPHPASLRQHFWEGVLCPHQAGPACARLPSPTRTWRTSICIERSRAPARSLA